jgi:hypothetical protein
MQAESAENVIASDMSNVSEQTVADCKEIQYFGKNGNIAGMEGVGGRRGGAPLWDHVQICVWSLTWHNLLL